MSRLRGSEAMRARGHAGPARVPPVPLRRPAGPLWGSSQPTVGSGKLAPAPVRAAIACETKFLLPL